MIRYNGAALDIPDATRGFTRFTPEQRADMAASHRLGYRQKARIGEAFWTHPHCPGVCFPTRAAALQSAVRSLASVRAGRDAT